MSKEVDRLKKENFSSKLRMDSSAPSLSKYHAENLRKHKELDSVMRKAREFQSNYWNKKILEVEERNPHRWRHSGYKEMYISGASSEISKNNSKSTLRDRSPRRRTTKSRSPRVDSPKSSRNNIYRTNSPKSFSSRNRISRSPRRKSPQNVTLFSSKPKSPINRRFNSSKSRSPKIMKFSNSRSKVIQRQTHCEQEKKRKSPSTDSTCSDQSCSVCSPKSFEDRRKKSNKSRSRSQSNSNSSTRQRSYENETASSTSKLHFNKQKKHDSSILPRTCYSLLKTHSLSSYSEEFCKISKKSSKSQKQKNLLSNSFEDPGPSKTFEMVSKHIKVENVRVNKPNLGEINLPAESSPSDESDSSSTTSHAIPPKMTLSERFGKMAQWSVDRRDMENMRITKVGDNTMKVVVEGETRVPGFGYDLLSPGHYPDALLTQGPRGLDCWDDVRVRYEYYKSRGYLRDLTLDDYIKWEEWWYKYQEWLEAERYYEQWTAQCSNRSLGNRKRRRRNNSTH